MKKYFLFLLSLWALSCVPQSTDPENEKDNSYLDIEGCWLHRGSVIPEAKFQTVDEVHLRIDGFSKTTKWLWLWQTEVDSCKGLYQESTFNQKSDSLLVLRSIQQWEVCGSRKNDTEYLSEREMTIEKTYSGFKACLGNCLFQSDQLVFESVTCDVNWPN